VKSPIGSSSLFPVCGGRVCGANGGDKSLRERSAFAYARARRMGTIEERAPTAFVLARAETRRQFRVAKRAVLTRDKRPAITVRHGVSPLYSPPSGQSPSDTSRLRITRDDGVTKRIIAPRSHLNIVAKPVVRLRAAFIVRRRNAMLACPIYALRAWLHPNFRRQLDISALCLKIMRRG